MVIDALCARLESGHNESSFSVITLQQDADGFISQGYPVLSKTPVADTDFSVTGYMDIQGGQQAELVLTFFAAAGLESPSLEALGRQ